MDERPPNTLRVPVPGDSVTSSEFPTVITLVRAALDSLKNSRSAVDALSASPELVRVKLSGTTTRDWMAKLRDIKDLDPYAEALVRHYPEKTNQIVDETLEALATQDGLRNRTTEIRQGVHPIQHGRTAASHGVADTPEHRRLTEPSVTIDEQDIVTIIAHVLDATAFEVLVPDDLRQFVITRPDDAKVLDEFETASLLRLPRKMVHDWIKNKILIGWKSAGSGFIVPTEQILGPSNIVPGISQVLDIISDPEITWGFLTERWPFMHEVMRPIDKLKTGDIEDVLNASPSFGTTFT